MYKKTPTSEANIQKKRNLKIIEALKLGTKICIKCGVKKPLKKFQRNQRDGNWRNVCYQCRWKRFRIMKGKEYKTLDQLREEKEVKRQRTKKICTVCRKLRSITEFRREYRSNRSADGHHSMCVYCQAIYQDPLLRAIKIDTDIMSLIEERVKANRLLIQFRKETVL